MSGFEKHQPTSLFVFSLKDEKLEMKRKICSPCDHFGGGGIIISSIIINGREELIVSCSHCNDIKLSVRSRV